MNVHNIRLNDFELMVSFLFFQITLKLHQIVDKVGVHYLCWFFKNMKTAYDQSDL